MTTEDISHIYRLARLLGEVRRELTERLTLRAGGSPSRGSRPLRGMTDAGLVNRCKLLTFWYIAAVEDAFGVKVGAEARSRDAQLWERFSLKKLLTLAKR